MQGNLAHLISAWSDNFDFSFFQRVPPLNQNLTISSKGGSFEKMKNQSCPIKLKLSQLNHLVKLCILRKVEHSSFKTDQFAYKSFYRPYCQIPLLLSDQGAHCWRTWNYGRSYEKIDDFFWKCTAFRKNWLLVSMLPHWW